MLLLLLLLLLVLVIVMALDVAAIIKRGRLFSGEKRANCEDELRNAFANTLNLAVNEYLSKNLVDLGEFIQNDDVFRFRHEQGQQYVEGHFQQLHQVAVVLEEGGNL